MQRPGAAHGDQGITARIAAFLDHMNARGAGHVFRNQVENAPGRFAYRHRQMLCYTGHGLRGTFAIEGHAAAEEVIRIEVAQQQAGIADRGPIAAPCVAGRPWIGAGTSRPDLEQAQFVDPGDRAAAGADFDHVDHRGVDWQAAAFLETVHTGGLQHGGSQGRAIANQAGLCRGAAHVEGNQVAEPEPGAGHGHSPDAAGGPRFQKPDRECGRGLGRAQTAERLHDVEAAGKPAVAQRRLQAADITRHRRPRIAVRRRGRGALVLAHLRVNLARQADRKVGIGAGNPLARGNFVHRIFISVQKTDRQRLDAVCDQRLDFSPQLRQIQRVDDVAIAVDAFRNVVAALARHQGLGKAQEQVVDVVALLAAYLQGIAKPGRGQQADTGAAALDDGVGDQGGAVHHLRQVRHGHAIALEDLSQPSQRAARRVVRGGQALVQVNAASRFVDQDEICERAANIETEPDVDREPPISCQGQKSLIAIRRRGKFAEPHDDRRFDLPFAPESGIWARRLVRRGHRFVGRNDDAA